MAGSEEHQIRFIPYRNGDGDERPQVGHEVSAVPGLYEKDPLPDWDALSKMLGVDLTAPRLHHWHQLVGGRVTREVVPGIFSVDVSNSAISPHECVPLHWSEMMRCVVDVALGQSEAPQAASDATE